MGKTIKTKENQITMTRLLTVALVAAVTSAISLRADEDQDTLAPPEIPDIPEETQTAQLSEETSVGPKIVNTVEGYPDLEFFNGIGDKAVVKYGAAKKHCEDKGEALGKKGRLAVLTDKSVRDKVDTKVRKYMTKTLPKYWIGFEGE